MADEYEVECPMPGCTESLHLEYETSAQFTPEDMDGGITEAIGPGASSYQRWKVACIDGHVILLPGFPSCGCEDPEGPDCDCDQDAYDHSDEHRTFRPHDRDRLIAVVEKLRSLA